MLRVYERKRSSRREYSNYPLWDNLTIVLSLWDRAILHRCPSVSCLAINTLKHKTQANNLVIFRRQWMLQLQCSPSLWNLVPLTNRLLWLWGWPSAMCNDGLQELSNFMSLLHQKLNIVIYRPLLGNDSWISKYDSCYWGTVSKEASFFCNERKQDWRVVFSVLSVPRCYK
jgi:hypothetical protein